MNSLWRTAPLVLILCLPAASSAQGPEKMPPGAASPGRMSGEVLETIDVAPYTYVRIKLGDEEVWIAGPQVGVTVGSRVSMAGGFPMKNFYSPTLERTFETIYFTSALSIEGQEGTAATRPPTHATPAGERPSGPDPRAAAPGAPSMQAAMRAKGAAAAQEAAEASAGDVSAVCTPRGGSTIAEIHAGKTALSGNEVLVRGVVVSFQPKIMGKNWIHIRDGSDGKEAGDLTLTTQDTAAVGNAVLVRGMVGVDRDFGHGYTYEVILEDAAVSLRRAPALRSPDTGTGRPHIPFVTGGSYPARPGNRVRPLIDGLPAFRRICEAIESATHSVFATIAFIHPDFVMPGDRGSLFDVLDRAAERGLDVRVLFWRSDPDAGIDEETHFPGLPPHREMLRRRGSTFGIRWDRAGEARCHHQKSWVIDAGRPGETAFVGGINLNPRSLASPGHEEDADSTHDVYVEVAGPSATDVHHSFVQRWNRASERDSPGGTWGQGGACSLEPPSQISSPRGNSLVQIQRTLLAARERAIFSQYVQAIDAAERTVYIENQALEDSRVIARLDRALDRGVAVTAVVPPAAEPFSRQLAALGRHEQFTLAALAAPRPGGERCNIHVHAKLMLVDDAFATIGSCNIRSRSFFRHTELNASFYDSSVVRALRCNLLSEHLALDTSRLDDVTALGLFAKTARDNARSRGAWQGLAFTLDPAASAA